MTGWFAAVGAPLPDAERQRLADALRALPLFVMPDVHAVGGWDEALAGVREVERDGGWWDFEEDARAALWSQAADRLGEAALAARVAEASAEQAARVLAWLGRLPAGIPADALDAARIAARLSLHQHAIAEWAQAPDAHWFHRKRAWFERGRWPIGVANGRFFLF